uniref:Uncharacterized protein n=1 Tax=Globisporangium ultimum (strain ATCC 200006 / CBS 805.95 / DAOM BR144) TaxID=431595 RepID=K3XBT9_GLOUD
MGRKRCPQESPRSTRTGQTSVDGDEAGMDAMKSVERTVETADAIHCERIQLLGEWNDDDQPHDLGRYVL